MSIPPLQVVERLDAVFEQRSGGGPSAGPDITEMLQGAASAAGCPIAILYIEEGQGFRLVEAHGLDAVEVTPAGLRFLAEAAHLCPDGLLTVQDASCRPGSDPEAPHLRGAGVPAVRFVAGVRVAGGAGRRHAVLVVADILPQAVLNAAKIAVLRAHAAAFSSRMEPSRRQSTIRQLRRFGAVAANANDAVPIGRTRPGGSLQSQAFRGNTQPGPMKIPGSASFPLPSSGMDRSAPKPSHPVPPLWEPIGIKLLNARNDGIEFWDELNIVPVSNGDGRTTHWVSVKRDAAPPGMAKQASVRARSADVPPTGHASRDGRTRLHDRDYFMDRLGDVLGRSMSNPDLRCVVLLIGMDRPDRADDGPAPHAHDFLLTEQTRRLQASVRLQDTLARIGGSEFALLIEGFDELTFVAAVARRIIEAMGRPVRFGNREIQSSCSIGVVHAPGRHVPKYYATGYRAMERHDGAEAMLQDAGVALQQARHEGIGGHVVFTGSTGGDTVPILDRKSGLPFSSLR